MSKQELSLSRSPLFLGIEGGATRTTAILADGSQAVARAQVGPGNLRLLSDGELVALFRALQIPPADVVSIGIGLAGARTAEDRARIRKAAERVWPGIPCFATNDLETAWLAAGAQSAAKEKSPPIQARVLVLSGTGSCCYGRAISSRAGEGIKVGGWGHLLGDHGSGYDLGLTALTEVLGHLDHTGCWPRLGARVLRKTGLNEPEDLIAWTHGASKKEIAELAVEVFAAYREGDRVARQVVAGAAGRLAHDAVGCARRLATPGTPLQFVFAGGVLSNQPLFARLVRQRIGEEWRGAQIDLLRTEGAWGAIELARQQLNAAGSRSHRSIPPRFADRPAVPGAAHRQLPDAPGSGAQALSPTERRNPKSRQLDRLSLAQAIRLMLREDATIPGAILAERAHIERTIRMIVRAFQNGGRLFYVGAGTSGRLGVLDASECPPTFRTEPEMVQGIMAGGSKALSDSVEGAEDDYDGGRRAIEHRGVGKSDVVVGIAASGRTPFVWGALDAARAAGAATVLVCCHPGLKIPRRQKPRVVIAPATGPEVLTGSTRLKAGTATKLILNLLTTLAMVRLGKVKSNLMIDLHPANAKLRDRAIRIVRQLAVVNEGEARRALERSGWMIKAALRRLSGSKHAPPGRKPR